LGRPKGRELEYSLKPVAEFIEKETNISVTFVPDLSELSPYHTGIILLENIRFNEDEESADMDKRMEFAQELAGFGDIYVNDSFPDYRESASTYDLAKLLPAYLGETFVSEVISLSKFSNPTRPFVAVLGGAKLSEKLDALLSLAKVADKIIIGGAMAYTLMKSAGIEVGKSLVEEEKLSVAKEIMEKFGDKIILPIDHKVVKKFENPTGEIENKVDLETDDIAVDIGVSSVEKYSQIISEAKSILWNGPMGVFEWEQSGFGTQEIGKAIISNKSAYKLVGGGDTISAIEKFGLTGFDYISMGGGAMLAFLAYDNFPILDIILDKDE
jgi:phosphoglycerate kinase